MNTKLQPTPATDPGREPDPRFEVLIAYEDFASGLLAKGLYNRLTQTHAHAWQFCLHLWKLDVLALPLLRDWAGVEAAEADLVIVAIRGDGLVSPNLRGWFESWPLHPGRGGALVALFCGQGSGVEAHGPSSVYLRQFAQARGLRFFRWRTCRPGLGRIAQAQAQSCPSTSVWTGSRWSARQALAGTGTAGHCRGRRS